MRTLIIWGALLLLPTARADVPVTALPYTAATPNRYFLAGDIAVPAGSLGFVVGASQVTLDLNGHTITCTGGATTMTRGVTLYPHSNFTLTNGRIRNCGVGVDSVVLPWSTWPIVPMFISGCFGSFGISSSPGANSK